MTAHEVHVISQCLADLKKTSKTLTRRLQINLTRRLQINLTRKLHINLTRKLQINLTRELHINLTRKLQINLTRELQMKMQVSVRTLEILGASCFYTIQYNFIHLIQGNYIVVWTGTVYKILKYNIGNNVLLAHVIVVTRTIIYHMNTWSAFHTVTTKYI